MAERVHTYLIVKQPGQPDRVLVWDTQDLSIGRAPENDLSFEMDEISRRHALFQRMDDAFVVRDLGTSNGTHVNGQAIESHRLSNGDVVRLAELEIAFHRIARNPASIGKKVEYASQLKSFDLPGGASASPEATMLGLGAPIELGDEDEEFEIRPAGEFDPRALGKTEPARKPAPAPRNLDLELQGLDELDLEPPGPAAAAGTTLVLEIEGVGEALAKQLRALLRDGLPLRVRIK
jgi:hypothetical protein